MVFERGFAAWIDFLNLVGVFFAGDESPAYRPASFAVDLNSLDYPIILQQCAETVSLLDIVRVYKVLS